jgi:hypothetical protein
VSTWRWRWRWRRCRGKTRYHVCTWGPRPLHSSTDFSAFGAQPSREAFVEPNTNRATVNTSTCRRHEDYRASHRRMLSDVRLRRTLTHSQGYKSYAVRTVISGWFVYHPHRKPAQRSQQAGTTVSIPLRDSTAPESPTFSMRYVSSSASRIWAWFERRTCR